MLKRIIQFLDCGKAFGRTGDLRHHLKFVHQKIKKAKCDVCGKGFGHYADMKIHYNTVHLGLKDYQCDSCEKR